MRTETCMITLPLTRLTNTDLTETLFADVTLGIDIGNVLFRKPVNVLLHEVIICTVAVVSLHLLNGEMKAAPDHSKCFTHQWEWKEARGQKQYKVKAIHTLESLPLPSHCRTVPGSQMTTRGVVVNTNYLKVQEGRVRFPELSWLSAIPVTHTFSRHDAWLAKVAVSKKAPGIITDSCNVMYAVSL